MKDFTTERTWGAKFLAGIADAYCPPPLTDQPCKWHVNDGAEVFVVLDGVVEMRYRENGEEKATTFHPSDIFVANVNDAEVAHPIGHARILVIEQKDSL